jgi:hypothetical protein
MRARQDEGSGSAAASRCGDRHNRSEALREAHLSRIKAKAGDEIRKVRGRGSGSRAGRRASAAGALTRT